MRLSHILAFLLPPAEENRSHTRQRGAEALFRNRIPPQAWAPTLCVWTGGPGTRSAGSGPPGAKPGCVGASCTGWGARHRVFCTFRPARPRYWGPLPTACDIRLTFLKPPFTSSFTASLQSSPCIPGAAQGAAGCGEHCHHPPTVSRPRVGRQRRFVDSERKRRSWGGWELLRAAQRKHGSSSS